MNKTIINIALASMLLMSATSCSDFLDVKPTGSLTEDEVLLTSIMWSLLSQVCTRATEGVKKVAMA